MKIVNFMELSLPGNSEKFILFSPSVSTRVSFIVCVLRTGNCFFSILWVGEVFNGLLMSQSGDY